MKLDMAARSPLALIFLGFGALVGLIGLAALLSSALFVARSEMGDGVVVAFQEPRKTSKAKDTAGAPKADPLVAPVIEFAGPGGKAVRITGGWFEKQPTYALGDRVPIRYNKNAPEMAIVDIFGEKWAFPVAFLALGATFLLAGLLLPRSRAR